MMGGILSKPKIPGPSPEQIKAEEEARAAQAEQQATLAKQAETAEQRRMEEMTALQKRKRRSRYGGRRMLLAERDAPEMGVPKKETLGG